MAQPVLCDGSSDRYYVFWETDNAYGSRGTDMTWEQASELAWEMHHAGDPNVAVPR
jgi:hypothetical protein